MVTTPYGKTTILLCALTCLAFALSSCTEQNGPQNKDTRAGKSTKADSTASSNTGVAATDTASARPIDIATETIVMKYAVKPGDVFKYRITERGQVAEGAQGVEDLKVYYYTKRILAVIPDSQITFSLRFDRIVVNSTIVVPDSTGKTQPRLVRYNSADSTNRKDPAFAQFSVLIGHEVTMVIRPDGTIIDIRNVEPVANKLITMLERDSVSQDERRFITNSIAVNTYGLVHTREFQVYPPSGKLDSTRSWKNPMQVPLLGLFPTQTVVTYHLDNVLDMKGRRVADISGSLESKILQRQQANQYGTITLKRGGITGSSEHLVDLDKGFTVFKKYKLLTDAEVSTARSDTKQTETTKQKTTTDFIVELL